MYTLKGAFALKPDKCLVEWDELTIYSIGYCRGAIVFPGRDAMPCPDVIGSRGNYRGTSLKRKRNPLEGVLWGVGVFL